MTYLSPAGTLSTLSINLSNSGKSPLPLQTGQTLRATVLEVQADGQLRLQLAGQTVEARSLLPLIKGQQLQVLVEVESSRIMLRLFEPNSADTALAQAWRNALPKELPLANVLQTLARLVQTAPLSPTPTTSSPAPSQSAAPTAPAVTSPPDIAQQSPPIAANPDKTAASAAGKAAKPLPEQVRQLLERLTPLSQLTTAEGLRKALLNAGLFFEGRLARGDKAALSEDFQAALLRLLSLVKAERNAPAATVQSAHTGKGALQAATDLLQELGQQLEGAAARIKVQQLHSLATQATSDPAWLLELPLRHNQESEVLRLRIQREAAKDESGNSGWSVRLHFDDRNHGATDTLVTLHGHRVGVKFWSEHAATASLFAEHFEELRSRLQQAGLEIGHLNASAGKAPPEAAPIPSGLLSIKA